MTDEERPQRKLDAADLERMNIPEEHWRTRAKRVPESVREVVTRYLQNIPTRIKRGAGLWVSGPPGVGKSAIASLICKAARSRLFTAFFIQVPELRECVRNRIMFEEGASILDRCFTVDVLALDDLCAEDATARMFGAFEIRDLIKRRVSRRKVTIVTTPLDLEELRGAFGTMVNSTQNGMVYFPVEGPNIRELQNERLADDIFEGEG